MLKYFFITWFFLLLCLIIGEIIYPSVIGLRSSDKWAGVAVIFYTILLFLISFLLVFLFDLYNDFGSFGFVIFFILVLFFFMLFFLPEIRIKNYSINIPFSFFLLFLLFIIFFTLSGYSFKKKIINMER